jgi:hypothetical protein
VAAKKIVPAALHALKQALTDVYWYKSDLRSFLTATLSKPELLSSVNWDDYKRNIVGSVVDRLARNQDLFLADLVRLMTEVARIEDYSHLERLDDGKAKATKARQAVQALRKYVGSPTEVDAEEEKVEQRRRAAFDSLVKPTAVQDKLKELTKEYHLLLGSSEPQRRGYRLEKILRELFTLFDLDPKASFKVSGEQIDGAFTFQSTDYLLEAKWQKELVNAADLDSLAGKLTRKLENTLGLYLSVNGFSEDGVRQHSSGRRLMILMDGSDLMAVLEARIDLIQLLLRKRRHASQTGNIYLRIHGLL